MTFNDPKNPDAYVADELDGWIVALLRSPKGAEIESPPDAILDSFHTSLAQRRQRILRSACGLAAAAVVLIASSWIELNRQARRPAVPESQSVAVVQPITPAFERARATFIPNGDTIAVPLESPSPDVTIVQLYPTTDTERRWQLELALQTNHHDSNGG